MPERGGSVLPGEVDTIIKERLRRANEEEWLEYAQTHGTCTEPREEKKEGIGVREVEKPGFSASLRQVFHVIHRTMDRHGQILLLSNIEVNVYWTSLEGEPWWVVELYREHATIEQFLECYQDGFRLRTVTVREISNE